MICHTAFFSESTLFDTYCGITFCQTLYSKITITVIIFESFFILPFYRN